MYACWHLIQYGNRSIVISTLKNSNDSLIVAITFCVFIVRENTLTDQYWYNRHLNVWFKATVNVISGGVPSVTFTSDVTWSGCKLQSIVNALLIDLYLSGECSAKCKYISLYLHSELSCISMTSFPTEMCNFSTRSVISFRMHHPYNYQ